MAVGALVLGGVLLIPSMQTFRRDSRSGGTLVPEGLSFRRDSRSDVLFPVLLLHRLLCGNLVIVISLVLVKIWGIEDEVRRMY